VCARLLISLRLLGRFDGIYTYFATNGFTHGSTTTNWARLASVLPRPRVEVVPTCIDLPLLSPLLIVVGRAAWHDLHPFDRPRLRGHTHPTMYTAHTAHTARILPGPADSLGGGLRTQTGNAKNSRAREEGKYYERMMSAAFNLDKVPEVISITSWNEWHEVTFLLFPR